jgi:hypothetical protein
MRGRHQLRSSKYGCHDNSEEAEFDQQPIQEKKYEIVCPMLPKDLLLSL